MAPVTGLIGLHFTHMPAEGTIFGATVSLAPLGTTNPDDETSCRIKGAVFELNFTEIKDALFGLLSFVYHQRIAGDFDKPAGCKGGFYAGQIRLEHLFQICVVDVAC